MVTLHSIDYIMLMIAVSYRRCGRNMRAKLYTAINSLSANHAYLKMLYSHTTWLLNSNRKGPIIQEDLDLQFLDNIFAGKKLRFV